jgi:hypothetical protein
MGMKIINRNEFLAMPPNTLYSNYEPCIFGPIQIKADTIGNDFYVQQISDSIKSDSSKEYTELLLMAENGEEQLSIDLGIEGRDGMFEDDQLFAVWGNDDINTLLNRLTECMDTVLVSKPIVMQGDKPAERIVILENGKETNRYNV